MVQLFGWRSSEGFAFESVDWEDELIDRNRYLKLGILFPFIKGGGSRNALVTSGSVVCASADRGRGGIDSASSSFLTDFSSCSFKKSQSFHR